MAFALNFGIVGIEALTCAPALILFFDSEDTPVMSQSCRDESIPQMESVVCYTSPSKPRACLAQVGNTEVFPVLATSSWGRETYRICSCPDDARDYSCNTANDLQLDLIFSKDNDNEATRKMAMNLQQMMVDDPVNGKTKVKQLVSELSRTAQYFSDWGGAQYDSWKGGTLKDLKVDVLPYKQYAAKFAGLGNKMSIISFRLYYYGSQAALNRQGVSVEELASHENMTDPATPDQAKLMAAVICMHDTVLSNALKIVSQTPPVNVIQPYLSCRPTLSSAFFTAAGIASANAGLLSYISLAVALFLIIQRANYTGNVVKWGQLFSLALKATIAAEKDKQEKDELRRNYESLRCNYESVRSELAEMRAFMLEAIPPGITPPPFLSAARHADHVPSPGLSFSQHRRQAQFNVDNPMLRMSGSADERRISESSAPN